MRGVKIDTWTAPLLLAVGLYFAWDASRAPVGSQKMASGAGWAAGMIAVGVAYGFARGRAVIRSLHRGWLVGVLVGLLAVLALVEQPLVSNAAFGLAGSCVALIVAVGMARAAEERANERR